MKNMVLKIFLYISLLPYIGMILYSIYVAIVGIDMRFVLYGKEAFVYVFSTLFYTFMFEIPILPICIVYQFFYLKWKIKHLHKEKQP